MDLTTKEPLDLVSIFDLMDNDFYIPDYQRGYRWTKYEVNKLLEDLEEFLKKPNNTSFYCLQPLVVFRNEDKKAWEVIDGQQRLTTIFLILNQKKDRLKEDYDINLFRLSYQNRGDSKTYLDNIDSSKKDDNIDYHYLFNANETIKSFKSNLGLPKLVERIVNYNNDASSPSVKFIWYDVTDEIKNDKITAEGKFSDLNIGKIDLTNAELIKALFLNNVNGDKNLSLHLSSEWDHIEHELQNENFWAFLYGINDGAYSTHIEFLFDVIKKKSASEKNEYYTFDKYSYDIKEFKNQHNDAEECKDYIKKLWKEVTEVFYLFKGWYEDRKLYHIIGYLRYKKTGIMEIKRIFEEDAKDAEDFYMILLNKAKIEFTNVDIKTLSYEKEKDKIYDLLLLFNILSVISCEKANLRFSFNEFYENSWDIEHIRSQTPNDVDGSARLNWIYCNLSYFSGIDFMASYDNNGKKGYKYFDVNKDGKINKKTFNLNQFENDVRNTYPSNGSTIVAETKTKQYKISDVCDELIDLLTKKSDVTQSDIYKVLSENVFKQDKAFNYEHNVGNLVLLDEGTNRGYKNAFFPVKREWIYRREYKEGIYILPCTKNVFSKTYSDMLFDQMNWNNNDAQKYMDEIERVIK